MLPSCQQYYNISGNIYKMVHAIFRFKITLFRRLYLPAPAKYFLKRNYDTWLIYRQNELRSPRKIVWKFIWASTGFCFVLKKRCRSKPAQINIMAIDFNMVKLKGFQYIQKMCRITNSDNKQILKNRIQGMAARKRV